LNNNTPSLVDSVQDQSCYHAAIGQISPISTAGQMLSRKSNPLDFKAEKGSQRWLDRLPSTNFISPSSKNLRSSQHTNLLRFWGFCLIL